ASVLITLAALFGYVNYRFLRLPSSIGLMLSALVASVVAVTLGEFGSHTLENLAREALANVDFNQALMHGMLSFLLFAGALHINLNDLADQKWSVGLLASLGVLISTLIVGYATYWLFGLLGHPVPLIYCLLFGALISPTDPIAVLSILKSMGADRALENKMAGESLFNDGVGVVVFLVLLSIATGEQSATAGAAVTLFIEEAIGGGLFGLVSGYVAYRMLRRIDDYEVEILITLALVMGGYALATTLHLSGPIAIVVAGLLIGNHGRRFAMSERTREHLDTFWHLVDGILNAVLFVLIGLEALLLHLEPAFALAAALAIPVVLLARLVAVSLPALVPGLRAEFPPKVILALTWGGLRGGISIALALSLPDVPWRGALVTVTYAVVVFSIVVQGLSVVSVLRRVGLQASSNARAAEE
ncbi:MAG: cation:proton antiporter, partial [Sphingomonadaceae bacterium]